MTSTTSFTIVSYTAEGSFQHSEPAHVAGLNLEQVADFQKRLSHLSGDLELPFEGKLPGDLEFIDYRIGSDLNGAYVLYYFHDEVIFASLLLSGNDDVTENELMEVFRFLLLDTHDQEEPSEDEIEAVLRSDQFDFPAIDDRPAVFEVPFSIRDDEAEACKHVTKMNRHLAAAFFDREND